MTSVWRAGLALAIGASSLAPRAHAQIRTDASLGRAAQTVQGPNYILPESLGRLAGSNLFHSFSVFNVNTGQSATFTTSTLGIANVLSRVTGGSPSMINGLLGLDAANGTPNFFFINPAGVLFGPGASINVPGAFHVSTADYIKFADGKFFADASAASAFSSAPPEAFGFLGTARATVGVKDGAALATNLLQPFSIVAGDIEIDGGNVATSGGDIRILALGQRNQEVSLAGPLPAAEGRLAILNGGYIFAPSSGTRDAGNVRVSAGSITIDGQGSTDATGIFSQADSGSGNAGEVNVTSTGNLSLLGGGSISSDTFSLGNAGSITVTADRIMIEGLGRVTGIFSRANENSVGDAGSVAVTARGNLSVINGAEIASITFSTGDAGSVTVQAGNITIDSQGYSQFATGIISQAGSGSGNAGEVNVTSTGNLSVLNGGQISSDTFASGDAGSVTVNAGGITIDRQGSSAFTGISSDAERGSTGSAGEVNVTAAGNLSLLGGGSISSDTFSLGNAGSVTVTADHIAIEGLGRVTGIFSRARENSLGDAGSVAVTARGTLAVIDGAEIASSTFSSGDAGSVTVQADSITLDSRGFDGFATGILSQAERGSTGRGGAVDVTAVSNLSVIDGGVISSTTFSVGDAGRVNVSADNITINRQGSPALTGIFSQAEPGSTGSAGEVNVTTAGSLSVLNGGQISSDTFSLGDAGSITVNAGGITIDRQGSISSDTFSLGNAGSVNVTADRIAIEGLGRVTGIFSRARENSLGDAGSVAVTARGTLSVIDGAEIASSTFSSGDAGSVTVQADSITIDSRGFDGFATGILSQAERGSTGRGGAVDVTAVSNLSVVNGGVISSSTFSAGDAGGVNVSAGNITIDSQGYSQFLVTGIISQAGSGSGNAGEVNVTSTDNLSVLNGGQINSSTFSSGDAGSVTVQADSITIDSRGFDGFATGILSQAERSSTGRGGAVDVTAMSNLSVINGGVISSTTFSVGDAGRVNVNAENMTIDRQGSRALTGIFSQTEAGSTGSAGEVNVTTAGSLSVLNGGQISSDTFSLGDAGSISVNAGDITIDRQGSSSFTGISSDAERGSTGNAGEVNVTAAGNLLVLNGGAVSSSTFASGNAGSVNVRATEDLLVLGGGTISSSTASFGDAGSVTVTARSLSVDGRLDADHPSSINARAGIFSLGQTGNVSVSGTSSITLSNGGELSITNSAHVPAPGSIVPTLLAVAAPEISLNSGGQITAASTGNVAASNIQVKFGSRLVLTDSAITTSAQDGNGGAIGINGSGAVALQNAQITTSVLGLSGNGGDISVNADALSLNTGFIQANTAAFNARGGNVTIDVQTLVPSGNSVAAGGQTVLSFRPGVFGSNVIQAAAPTGVSGNIQITTPALDVSASLSGLNAKVIDTGGLGRSLCQTSGGSSLAQTGRGGLPPSARDLLRFEPMLPTDASGQPNTNSASGHPYLFSKRGCPGQIGG